ncbi:MAG: diacylglycerol/lipid kinase family protein [Actinomycetota bacterium]
MSDGRSVGLVVNPTSGRGKAARILPELHARLVSMRCDVEVLTSSSAGHASELAAGAAGRHEVVAAVGGDGMVACVAQGVIGSAAALGIVPSGTGNDFAANLGYARRKPLEACAVIAHGRRRRVDVGRIEGGRAFLCVAGGGFDSEVNRESNRIKHLRGTAVYLVAVFRTLRLFTPARFTIGLDGEERSFDGMFVAIGNASSYGGGMRITPDAKLDDGVFDVCLVKRMGKLTLLSQLPRLFTGGHVRHPAVEIARAARVTLAADRPFMLYADGEEAGPLPVTLTVEPAALDVVAP